MRSENTAQRAISMPVMEVARYNASAVAQLRVFMLLVGVILVWTMQPKPLIRDRM